MLKYPKCAASAKRQRATWDKLHEVRASRIVCERLSAPTSKARVGHE